MGICCQVVIILNFRVYISIITRFQDHPHYGVQSTPHSVDRTHTRRLKISTHPQFIFALFSIYEEENVEIFNEVTRILIFIVTTQRVICQNVNTDIKLKENFRGN